MLAVCARFPPLLVLFPAPAGHDIGPRTAFHLQALYCPDAELVEPGLDPLDEAQTDPSGTTGYVYRQLVFRRELLWQEHLAGSRPVVLTLAHDDELSEPLGDDEAEVVVLHAPRASDVTFCRSPTDPSGELATAQVVIGAGGGLADEARFELVRELARRIGAVPAASRTVCDRGLAGRELLLGLDGHAIGARVYLAFGISGSSRHLAALSPHTQVVAINTDPAAPIFKIARFGLVADAEQTLRDLLATLAPAAAQRTET